MGRADTTPMAWQRRQANANIYDAGARFIVTETRSPRMLSRLKHTKVSKAYTEEDQDRIFRFFKGASALSRSEVAERAEIFAQYFAAPVKSLNLKGRLASLEAGRRSALQLRRLLQPDDLGTLQLVVAEAEWPRLHAYYRETLWVLAKMLESRRIYRSIRQDNERKLPSLGQMAKQEALLALADLYHAALPTTKAKAPYKHSTGGDYRGDFLEFAYICTQPLDRGLSKNALARRIRRAVFKLKS